MGVLCTWVKLVTDSQNLGRELHRNACGGWAPPGPAGGASRYKGEGKGEKGWVKVGRDSCTNAKAKYSPLLPLGEGEEKGLEEGWEE